MTENVLVKFPDPPPPNAHIELVDEHRAVVEMRYVPDYLIEDSSQGHWRCVTNGNRGQNWSRIMTTAIHSGLVITWRIPPIEVQDGQMIQVRFSDNVCAAGKLVRLPDGGVRVEVDVPEPQADMLRRLVSDGAFTVRHNAFNADLSEEIADQLNADPPGTARLRAARAKVHGTDPALASLPDDDAAGDLLARRPRRPVKDNPQA